MDNAEQFYRFKIVTANTNELMSVHEPKDCIKVSARFHIIDLIMNAYVSNEYMDDTNGKGLISVKKMLKTKLKEHMQAVVDSLNDDGEDQGRMDANAYFVPFIEDDDTEDMNDH